MLPASWPDWVPWIIGAGAIATALLAITTLAVKTGRGMKAAADWFARIVRDEVGDIVDARLAPIIAEIRPNGGASLKDQMGRVDRAVVHLATWAARHDPEGFATPPPDGGGSSVSEGM